MATTPPPLTPFGGATPQRGDKTTFSSRFDAFITWFIACITQFVALAANVYANAQEAFTSAATATSAAATAAATANATPWVSGATIQQYAAVISPADGRTYRRTAAAGSGTIDPSLDTTNYVMLSGQPSSMALLASYTVGSAVTNIDFLSLFTATYDRYLVDISGLSTASNATFVLQIAKAGVAQSTGYYADNTGNSTTGCSLGFAMKVAASVEIYAVNDASGLHGVFTKASCSAPGSSPSTTQNFANYAVFTSGAILSGLRVSASGASITAGTVRVYGIKNS